jgi:hypothetical protein
MHEDLSLGAAPEGGRHPVANSDRRVGPRVASPGLQFTSDGFIKLVVPRNHGWREDPNPTPDVRIYLLALGLVAAELLAHELSVRVLREMLRLNGLHVTTRQGRALLREAKRQPRSSDHRARDRARAHASQPVPLWVMRGE